MNAKYTNQKTHKKPQLKLKPAYLAVLLAFAAPAIQANPLNPTVVNGHASFVTSGNTLTVTNAPGTIINWKGFSIGANEITRFAQQSASSAVLNRVTSNNPSNILGTLQSNGRVFLINPNGIVFGAGATVDVAGLVASTLNLSNADFLAGRYSFTKVPGAQNLSNAGKVTAHDGGQIYMIAPDVENTGVITAPNGEILLAAGHSVDLVNTNTPNLIVNITAPAGNATNVGQLIASSGRLGLFGTVVRNSGTVSANSATMQGGKIVFKASQRTKVSGSVTANGTTGGTIHALGNEVGIMDGATISADGAQGGGTILVGGDYQGKNPDVQNAQVTYVAPTATISADASQNGDGGRIIVWADNATRAYGSLSARGGINGGNGGFIETSGHYLDVAGIRIDTTAPNGQAGTWLLDPYDVTITATTDVGGTFVGGIWTPTATGSTITAATIVAALNAGNAVTITTTGGALENGDITVNAPITMTGATPTTLTLQAENFITINQPISSINATPTALNLVLNHGALGDATLASTLALAGGNLDIQNAGTSGAGKLIVIGGSTSLTGTFSAATLAVNGGSLSLDGATPTSLTSVWLTNGTLSNTAALTTGTLTVNPSVDFSGVYLSGAGSKTVTGALNFSPCLNCTSSFHLSGGVLNTQGTTAYNKNGLSTLLIYMWDGAINNTGTWMMDGIGFDTSGGVNSFTNGITGIIDVAGAGMSVGGSFTWINAGTLTINGDSALDLANGALLNNTGTINLNLVKPTGSNLGPFTVSAGSATVNNDIAGTINVTGTYYTTAPTNLTFNNAGTVNVAGIAGGAGDGTISYYFNIPGGVDSGSYNLASGVTLLPGGTRDLNAGTSFTGNGTVLVNTSTLRVNTSLVMPNNLFLSTSSRVEGTGSLTVNGSIDWMMGVVALAGPFTTYGYSNVSSGELDGTAWINYGTLELPLAIGPLTLSNGASLTNASIGTMNLLSSNATPIVSGIGVGTFINEGFLNQNSTGMHTIGSGITFSNSGTVKVSVGTLDIAGGFLFNDGQISVAPGATFMKAGGFTNNGTLSGAGTFDVGVGTLTNNGLVSPGDAIDPTGTLTILGNFTQASIGSLDVRLDSAIPGEYDVLAVSGTATLDGIASFDGTGGSGNYAFLTASSALGTFLSTAGLLSPTLTYNAGSIDATLAAIGIFWDGQAGDGLWSNPINWSTDILPGSSDNVTIGAVGNVSLTSGNYMINTLVCSADLYLSGGSLAVSGNATFNSLLTISGGTLTLDGASNLNGATSINGGTLSGSGVIVIPAGGTLNWINGVINGSGPLMTQAGSTTTLAPGFAQTVALRGSRVWDNFGTVIFTPNAGTLSFFQIDDTIADGTAVFNNQAGGQFNINASFNDTHITGFGAFNNAGTLNKNLNGAAATSGFAPVFNNQLGGIVNVNSGTLRFDAGGTDAGNYFLANGSTLHFSGGPRTITGDIGGVGNVVFSKQLTANAVYTVSGDYNISGSTIVDLADLAIGTLIFNGTVTNLGTSYTQSGGVADVSFAGITGGAATGFQNLTSITVNNGSLVFANGTNLFGVTSLVRAGGGTLDLANNNIFLSNLTVSGGTLTGSGNITVTTGGSFGFGGPLNAAISGSGMLITQSGVTTNVTPGFARTALLSGSRVWDNFGTVIFTPDAGTLSYFQIDDTTADGTAVFNNQAGGQFNINASFNDTHIIGVGTFNNAGTLNKNLNGTAATSGFAPVFNNLASGVVNVNSGMFNITGALTQSGTINVAMGTTFSKTAGFINNGTLNGLGTIAVGTGAAALINQGNINPGGTGTAGTLSITGDLQLSTGSILNMELGGTAAGQYDVLAVSGALTGNPGSFGTLALTKINGYTVTIGDSYQLLAAASGVNTATFAPFALARANLTPTYNTTNFTLGVTPMVITITADALSKVYGTTDPALTYVASGFDTGDSVANILSGALTRLAGENAGSYAITQGSLVAVDYTLIYVGNNLTITPATLTYTANAASRIYGAADPAFGGSVTGFVLGDTLATATTGAASFTTTALSTSNVGSYAINGSGLVANNGNYVFVQAAGNSTALTINPATLTYTANLASRTYGAANPAFSGSVSGFVLGDTLATATTGTGIYTTTALSTSNVGSYAINGSGLVANNGNYVFVQAAGNSTALTINPATLTYTANLASRTYGAVDPAFSGSVTGFVLSDTLATATTGAASFTTTALSTSNVGSYAINGSGLVANNGNYVFVQAAGNSTALTINPALLTVTASNATKIYDAIPWSGGNGVTYTGFVNGETNAVLGGTLTYGGTSQGAVNTGSYLITPGGLTSGNYSISYVDGMLTIDPATLVLLSVTASNASKTYGTTLTFAGTEFTPVGLLGGDTISGVTLASAGAVNTANAGTYAITPSNAVFSVGSASNYTISYVDGILTVNPALLTITADALSKIYGNADPALTYVASGFVNGDTVASLTGALSRVAGQNVGSYAINQGTLNNSNYSITYTGNSFSITPALLTVTASNATKIYDAIPYSGGNGVTYTGLTNGDTFAALGGTLTYSGTSQGAVNTGSYVITPGGLTSSNYNISYVGGMLTINPAMLSLIITASDASKTYGTSLTFAGTEFTPVGLIGADTISGVTLTSTGAVNTANAGTYAITPSNAVFSVGDPGNYSISYMDGTLTVNPAPLTITADALSKIYGNADPALTYTATGLLFSDTLTGSLSRATGENVGSYVIDQGSLANSNYAIAFTGNTLSITPRDITIAADAITKVYGDADPSLTFAVGGMGLASWDNSATAFTGTLTRAAGENVATSPYAISQGTLAANANYILTGFTGSNLTITQALLSVYANPTSKVLNTVDPLLTYTVSGLKLSDTEATTLNGGSLVRDPGEATGSYQIKQGTLALSAAGSSNYTMNYVPASFTILLPTVINEVINTSLLVGTPDTGSAQSTQSTLSTSTSDEEEEKPVELVVVADTSTSSSASVQSLPVCQ